MIFSILIPLLAGCASSRVPREIGEAPEKPVLVSQVQQEPDRFLDQRVRWGGTIIAVRKRKRTTEIEILSRLLDAHGRPRGKKPGTGRFVALLTGFADPAEYPEKRSLTVTGRLKRVEIRPIGEYSYFLSGGRGRTVLSLAEAVTAQTILFLPGSLVSPLALFPTPLVLVTWRVQQHRRCGTSASLSSAPYFC